MNTIQLAWPAWIDLKRKLHPAPSNAKTPVWNDEFTETYKFRVCHDFTAVKPEEGNFQTYLLTFASEQAKLMFILKYM